MSRMACSAVRSATVTGEASALSSTRSAGLRKSGRATAPASSTMRTMRVRTAATRRVTSATVLSAPAASAS
eukprot:scaffold1650_cov351-Prasinococcus_capsulatus_cf.AAC.19